MSNECAISREKFHLSTNPLKYRKIMAESYQIKEFSENILMRTAKRSWIESIQTVN